MFMSHYATEVCKCPEEAHRTHRKANMIVITFS